MSRKKAKQTPKRVLRLPDLDFAKSAVLNTLGITRKHSGHRRVENCLESRSLCRYGS
jgi:hypothetical protein